MRAFLWLLAALPMAVNAAPLAIDGQLNETEWRDARVFDDFRQVQPLTGKASPYATKVRMLSTPEGLAFGFTVAQPKSLPRSKPATPRDQASSADRVNVYVDYDGNGQAGYNFTVSLADGIEDGTLVDENSFTTDWDGEWQHAVSETEDGYFVEMLLPWSLTAMQKREGEMRRIAVHFDQVIQATGERFGLRGISYNQSRYLSAFLPVEVRQYEQSLFNAYPYASVLSDQVGEDMEYRAGVDLFWKPRGDFQLTASVNPDFGQVESDDLVVDFSAIETYFSDKRPFFTENQEPFRLSAPDDAELIYTRRIGGSRDDGEGAADIDAALKLNGSAKGFEYAYLGAWERDYADDEGKAFNVLRGRYSSNGNRLGYVLTDTDRPFLERRATVHGADFDTSLDALRLRGQVLESRIAEAGEDRNDSAGWLLLNLDRDDWQHELELAHYGQDFDLNDIGYLRRGNLNQFGYEASYFDREHPADSAIGATQWTFEFEEQRDDGGLRLNDRLSVKQRAEYRTGGQRLLEVWQDLPGHDDLISRGHGVWNTPARTSLYGEFESTRVGDWKWFLGGWSHEEGLSGRFYQIQAIAKYFVSDALNLRLMVAPRYSKDWLIWEGQDNEFGRYERMFWRSDFDLSYIPVAGSELRLKLQWLAIDAKHGRDYRLEDGEMRATGAERPDFAINNFGLQLRYRYELAPLSDLFIVYSRGGFAETEERGEGSLGLLDDATRLRDSDQIFVKIRYRL
ncbi:MAG: hypothetical protein HYV16_11270 [Gammaproteobacteria bacterium]|nr:hypothetical protein [Gammaproteobacteria bacterium]